MKRSFFIFLAFVLITIFAFAQNIQMSYKEQIEQWHAKRVSNLKSETGWLTVSGLYWLKEGANTAGSSKENQIVFPKGKADDKVGTFTLKNGEVSLSILPGVLVKRKDTTFSSGVIFNNNIEEQTIVLEHKSLRWFIIKRGNKIGVRLRDVESEARKNFSQIERFPVEEMWRVTATYEAPNQKKTIPIHDVIGLTTETEFGGTLHFQLNGKNFTLDATSEDENLFIVFADETSGISTYGGGRFIYAIKPKEGNKVELDFNKAYNPPCAFTDFATCPLPPDQNKLSIEITAGEKRYGHH